MADRWKRKRGRREMGVASLRVNRLRRLWWWCAGRKLSEYLRRRRRRERESGGADSAERVAMDWHCSCRRCRSSLRQCWLE